MLKPLFGWWVPALQNKALAVEPIWWSAFFYFQSSTPKKPESDNPKVPSCYTEPDFPCCSTSPIVPNTEDQSRCSINQTGKPGSINVESSDLSDKKCSNNLPSNGTVVQANCHTESTIPNPLTDPSDSTFSVVPDIPVCALDQTLLSSCKQKLTNDSPAVLQVEVTKFWLLLLWIWQLLLLRK